MPRAPLRRRQCCQIALGWKISRYGACALGSGSGIDELLRAFHPVEEAALNDHPTLVPTDGLRRGKGNHGGQRAGRGPSSLKTTSMYR
jgi:hypothetical protein